MKRKIISLLLLTALLLTSCVNDKTDGGGATDDIPDDNSSYGDDLNDLGVYDGLFDGSSSSVTVTCISGTPDCYTLENNVLTFTALSADSVYSVTGTLSGSITVDVGDEYKLDLEMHDFSLISNSVNPITVLSGNEVSILAKKDTKNYIYDNRPAISVEDTTSLSGAIHSEVDLEIAGKGELYLVSENNNGIHSKDDLQVKNLTLTVVCKDNALKGNDSVQLENATATLISTVGDCIKTTRSDISEKGNQRSTVSLNGGSYTLYAACDGIDAAYNVTLDGDPTLNIYTDKYSNYSEQVTAVTEDSFFIRFNYSDYKYSIKYYNFDSDYLWVNPEYHSTVSGGRSQYYYYSFPKNESFDKLQFFIYTSDMEQGQDTDYVAASDYLTPSDAYDTIALTVRGQYLYYDWTNYSTTINKGGPGGFGGGPGGMGGMDGGNTDKGDHSTKGIKADNEIIVNSGNLTIKSYDDSIHANSDTTLENGEAPTGNITLNGGSISLYSNDDGIHSDGTLTVTGSDINIVNSYEGLEGITVNINDGNLYVVSKDDGINGIATSGAAITVSGGTLYVYAGGDGIDSNSRTSYGGILFSGGRLLIISTGNGNSAIDSEQGYSYTGGSVVAIMPRGGMSDEATRCQNFSSVANYDTLSLSEGGDLVCNIGADKLTVNMPAQINGYVIMLGDSSATASTSLIGSGLSKGEFLWE
ncbi:MAG: carbohydrate-binding domain-containing protein [Clostridia bacterium]|nr:carbohydrate-binding domain-containing protein [Clostridia bacterium]